MVKANADKKKRQGKGRKIGRAQIIAAVLALCMVAAIVPVVVSALSPEKPTIYLETNAAIDFFGELTGEMDIQARVDSHGEEVSEIRFCMGYNADLLDPIDRNGKPIEMKADEPFAVVTEPYFVDGDNGFSVQDGYTMSTAQGSQNRPVRVVTAYHEEGSEGLVYVHIYADGPLVMEDRVCVVPFLYDEEATKPWRDDEFYSRYWLDENHKRLTWMCQDADLSQFNLSGEELVSLEYNFAGGSRYNAGRELTYDGTLNQEVTENEIRTRLVNEKGIVQYAAVSEFFETNGDTVSVMFLDYNNEKIGNISVPRDSRAKQIVSDYVEETFIHPDLRISTAGEGADALFGLTNEANYRGKYMNSGGMTSENQESWMYFLTNLYGYSYWKRPMVKTSERRWRQLANSDGTAFYDKTAPYAYGWTIVHDPENGKEKPEWMVWRDAVAADPSWSIVGTGELVTYSGWCDEALWEALPLDNFVGISDLPRGFIDQGDKPARLGLINENPAYEQKETYFSFADFEQMDSYPYDTLIVKAVYEPTETATENAGYQLAKTPYVVMDDIGLDCGTDKFYTGKGGSFGGWFYGDDYWHSDAHHTVNANKNQRYVSEGARNIAASAYYDFQSTAIELEDGTYDQTKTGVLLRNPYLVTKYSGDIATGINANEYTEYWEGVDLWPEIQNDSYPDLMHHPAYYTTELKFDRDDEILYGISAMSATVNKTVWEIEDLGRGMFGLGTAASVNSGALLYLHDTNNLYDPYRGLSSNVLTSATIEGLHDSGITLSYTDGCFVPSNFNYLEDESSEDDGFFDIGEYYENPAYSLANGYTEPVDRRAGTAGWVTQSAINRMLLNAYDALETGGSFYVYPRAANISPAENIDAQIVSGQYDHPNYSYLYYRESGTWVDNDKRCGSSELQKILLAAVEICAQNKDNPDFWNQDWDVPSLNYHQLQLFVFAAHEALANGEAMPTTILGRDEADSAPICYCRIHDDCVRKGIMEGKYSSEWSEHYAEQLGLTKSEGGGWVYSGYVHQGDTYTYDKDGNIEVLVGAIFRMSTDLGYYGTWTSSNEDVAVIGDNGKIYIVEDGDATISCNQSGTVTTFNLKAYEPFLVSRDNRKMIGYTEETTNLVIPGYITGDDGTRYKVVGTSDASSRIEWDQGGYWEFWRGAFWGQDNLVSVTLPDTMTYLGAGSFANCKNLTAIHWGGGVTGIGPGAFHGCDSLTSVEVPDTVKYIMETAFEWCENLESVTLPDGLVKVGAGAFQYCPKLKELILPDSVTAMGKFIADHDSALETLYIGPNVQHMQEFGIELTSLKNLSVLCCGSDYLRYSNWNNSSKYTKTMALPSLTTVTVGNRTEEKDADYASYYLDCLIEYRAPKVETVTILDGPKTLTSSWSRDNAYLKTVNLPSTLTTMSYGQFRNCTALSTINLENTQLTKIPDYGFYGCTSLSENAITLPNTVTAIGEHAFEKCNNLTVIEAPETVTSIGSYAFAHCDKLTDATIHGSVKTISADMFYEDHALETVVLGEGVSVIGDDAFDNCTALANLTLPSTITKIGNRAFKNCSSLPSVDLIGTGCTSIGSEAFYNCINLASIDVPGTCTSIGSGAFEHCSAMTTATLEEGVKTIGSKAFYYCSNLQTASVPSTVTSIGDSAFSKNTSLTNITFAGAPNGLTIGSSAFYDCTSLTNIDLPEGTRSIGGTAFYNCHSLQSFTMPSTVTTLGSAAFRHNNSMQSYTVAEPNNYFTSVDGVLYNEALTRLWWYPIGNAATEYNVLDTTTTIGEYAFEDAEHLRTVTLPVGLTSIEDYAFHSCGSLSKCDIPATVRLIDGYAFALCSSMPAFVVDDASAFFDDPDGVLYNKDHTKLYYWPMAHVYEPETYAIDAACTTIGHYAFYGCSLEDTITVPDAVDTIEEYAFAHSKTPHVNIPTSLVNLGSFAFNYAAISGDITIPGTVETIHVNTFSFTPNLGYVTLADGVTGFSSYGSNTNEDPYVADSADGINLSYPSNAYNIGGSVFAESGITGISFPSGFSFDKLFGNAADRNSDNFRGCNALKEVAFRGGWTTGLGNPNDNYYSRGTHATPDENEYRNVFGTYYRPYNSQLFANLEGLETVVMPATISNSAYGIFYNCPNLKNIVMPETLNKIPQYFFYNCDGITSLDLPEKTTLGYGALYDCDGLTELTIGATESHALDGLHNLSTVTVREGVATLGSNAFYNLDKLTTVNLPSTLTTIGSSAFQNCTALTTIELPEGLAKIDSYAFQNCTALTTVILPSTLATIGSGAFWSCTALTAVNIPDGLTGLGDHAFYNCDALTEISIPISILTVPEGCFQNCDALASVTLLTSTNAIGNNAFANCPALANITLPENVTKIGNGAFDYCSGLTSISLPNAITSIGEFAFRGCSSLGTIDVPGEATIGRNCFQYCSNLTRATLESGIRNIPSYCFYGCTKLAQVDIPDTVTTIDTYAFYNCRDLNNIIIPSAISYIREQAFGSCTSLNTATAHIMERTWQELLALNHVNATGNDTLINATIAFLPEEATP